MTPDLAPTQEKLAKLFSLIGINKVVHVDDEYNITPENIAARLLLVDPNLVKEWLELQDVTDVVIQTDEIVERLNQMEEDTKGSLYAIDNKIIIAGITEPRSKNRTFELFSGHEFMALSHTEWNGQAEELLEEGKNYRTLFLFDNNLGPGKENAGISIIQDVLSKHAKVICGLISSTFEPEEEYERWKHFTTELQLDKNRFALISKNHKRFSDSAQSIKLIALNEFGHKLTHTAESIIETALKSAQAKLRELDIFDLEFMVFHTSRSEGVWEFDTLMRVLQIYQRRELLEWAKSSSELEHASTQLRDIAKVKFVKPSTNPSVKKIREWEMYDDKDYLNRFYIPLELGDIFTISSNDTNGTPKDFILLTQSCDLMVREEKPAGSRHADLGVLAEISPNKPPNPILYYELDYYGTRKIYVNFKNAFTVNLTILDLCVFDPNGQANWSYEANCPPLVTSPWKIRYENIKAEFSKAIEEYKILVDALNGKNADDVKLALRFIPSLSSAFNLELQINDDITEIKYPIQRIKRLRQPFSSALLTRYAHSVARDAFEHDFAALRQNNDDF